MPNVRPTMPDEPESSFEPIFVARQPIFDRERAVWGHELLFRHSQTAGAARFEDADVATSKVIADGLSLARPGGGQAGKLLINFPRNLLLEGAAFALPPDTCVVEILETVEPEPAILEALSELKAAGYILALDDFVGQEGFEPFLELADIVKVDVLGQDPRTVAALYARLKPYGCTLLAEKIEDHRVFELTRKLGFDLFQGFFFSRPVVIPGRKVTVGQLSRLQLIQELGADYDPKKLAAIIAGDISLSYRLLRYINSASFGLRHKVESIKQAIVVLGQRQLSQWLRVVVLSDLNDSGQAAPLAALSVQRARFLELLAMDRPSGLPSDAMFLLGLFSFLDALLHQPMAEILAHLPLDDVVRDALLGQPSPAGQWLFLASAWERGEWGQVAGLLARLGVAPEQAALLYAESLAWAQAVLGASTGGSPARCS